MTTERKRTPCTLSLKLSQILRPFLHLQNFRKSKSLWTSVQILVSNEWRFLLTSQHLVWEGSVGVERSRKALHILWGHCKKQWKSSWISGNVFSRSRDVLVCGRDSKAAVLPETFQIWLPDARANFVERQFQFSVPGCLSNARPVKLILFPKPGSFFFF